MRRDARERREALINAAAECFSTAGYMVPLEAIAERAGVGRGTLYRNFPDRMALALAIFEREVDRVEANIDPSRPLPAVIAQLARDGTKAKNLFARLAHEMAINEANLDAFHQLGHRFEGILQPLVDKAHETGELRADLEARHIVRAMRMTSGLLSPWMTAEEVDAEIDQAISMLVMGLRPR